MWIGERSGKESPQEEVLDLDEANDSEEVEGLRGARGVGWGAAPDSEEGEGLRVGVARRAPGAQRARERAHAESRQFNTAGP